MFLTKGVVIIFVVLPTSAIAIVGCIKGSGAFNEQKILFDQESTYGSMIVAESNVF